MQNNFAKRAVRPEFSLHFRGGALAVALHCMEGMSRSLIAGLLIAIALTGCAGQKDAQLLSAGATAAPRQFTEGEALYVRYCSGCHGWEGRGDGPMAIMFEVHPPPLAALHLSETEMVTIIKVLHGDSPLVLTDSAKIPSMQADVSALMTHLKRLPELEWEKVDQGRRAYETLCAFCHGVYGGGDGILASAQPRPPRNLAGRVFQSLKSDEQLSRIISEGAGTMPGAKAVLQREDIDEIVRFVRVLSPGYELYDRFCARCHGSDGYPPVQPAEDIFGVPPLVRENLVGAVFDEDYFRNRPESYIRSWVETMYQAGHSSMPRFNSELDRDDVLKIVKYLRGIGIEQGG
jgi:mono/diheme cytochrome c family protein